VLDTVAYNFPEEQKRTTPTGVNSLAQAAAMAEIYGNAADAQAGALARMHGNIAVPATTDNSIWGGDPRAYVHRGPTIINGEREDVPDDSASFRIGGTIGGPIFSEASLRDMGCWFGVDDQMNLIKSGHIPLDTTVRMRDCDSVVTGPWAIIDTDSPEREPTATEYLSLLRNTQLDYFIEPIVERIQYLADLAAEEGDDQIGLRQESMSALLKFLYIHKDRIHNLPSIILTAGGNLRAEWRRHSADRVALEFVDKDRIMFVTFLPDPKNPTRTNRVAGAAGLRSFFESTATRDL